MAIHYKTVKKDFASTPSTSYVIFIPKEAGKRFKINSVLIGYVGASTGNTPSCDIWFGHSTKTTDMTSRIGRGGFSTVDSSFRYFDLGGYIVPSGEDFMIDVRFASSTTISVNYEEDDGL